MTLLPVKICDDVTIGAGSVVTKDILEPVYMSAIEKSINENIRLHIMFICVMLIVNTLAKNY